MPTSVLSEEDLGFIESQPVARLATADAAGVPHAVPICFVVLGNSLYFTIDEKPKRVASRPLKRMRNLAENPHAAVVIDRYDADWSRLGWVLVRGAAEVVESGAEHIAAQEALRARYPQYRAMTLEKLPVVAIRIARVARWGNLAAGT